MPSNRKIAIAAHLHVLLRRKTGRVTDTEWLASNNEYAHEIARFARERSAEAGNADLALWADRLEEAITVPDSRPAPLIRRVVSAVRERNAQIDGEGAYPESGFAESTSHSHFGEGQIPAGQPASRYVKSLR